MLQHSCIWHCTLHCSNCSATRYKAIFWQGECLKESQIWARVVIKGEPTWICQKLDTLLPPVVELASKLAL